MKRLNIGGRLFAVIGEAPAMTATVFKRVAEKEWEEEKFFETVLPTMINVSKPTPFEF